MLIGELVRLLRTDAHRGVVRLLAGLLVRLLLGVLVKLLVGVLSKVACRWCS